LKGGEMAWQVTLSDHESRIEIALQPRENCFPPAVVSLL
jgi:hypothetical protein